MRLTRWVLTPSLLVWLSCASVNAAVLEWVPVRATGPHEIRGNEIVLEHGGQRVWFEARVREWAPVAIAFYYLYPAGTEFGTRRSGLPSPATPLCESDTSCEAALGYASGCGDYCAVVDFVMDACSIHPECTDACELRCFPAYVDVNRPDFLLSNGVSRLLVFRNGFGYAITGEGDLSAGLIHDDGSTKYLATFVVDVPPGWAGTLTLGLGAFDTVWGLAGVVAPLVRIPGVLTIPCRESRECDDRNDCTDDRCDPETGRCVNDERHDPAVACCNPYTGQVRDIVEDLTRCTYEQCNPRTGAVVNRSRPAGSACGVAGDTCNPPGTCSGYHCLPQRPHAGTPCGDRLPGVCSFPYTCDGNGRCVANPRPDGTPCADGVFCNGVDECENGECVPVGDPRCGGEDLCFEDLETCAFSPSPLGSVPPHNGTVSRRFSPMIVLFDGEIRLPTNPPAEGDFELRSLREEGRTGHAGATCRMGFVWAGDGPTRMLTLFSPYTFAEKRWYTLRHVGHWGGLPPFEIHFLVQPGDVNGDGRVNAVDLTALNNAIRRWRPGDPFLARFDVNADLEVDLADLQFVAEHIPTLRVPKPSGHAP